MDAVHSSACTLAAVLIFCCTPADAMQADPAAAIERSGETPRKRLDLRAPDITEIFTPQQIAVALGQSREHNIEEVEVQGVRDRATPPSSPEVWPAIAAPIWALLHPAQSWRIFAPIPHDRAQYIGSAPPDATSTQREPATGIPRMAGQ